MTMELVIHKKMSRKIARDVKQLSLLLSEADEDPLTSFLTTAKLVSEKNGLFFVVTVKGIKVAYGVFAYGTSGRSVRRLQYFAVEKEWRHQGLGEMTLTAMLDQEVDLNMGCTVCCKRSLKRFYEKVGFKYWSKTEDNPDLDILILTSSTNYDSLNLDFHTCHFEESKNKLNRKIIKKHLGVNI